MSDLDSEPWRRLRRGWRRLRDRLAFYNLSGIWNPLFDLWTGGDQREVVFDIDRTMPELREIDRRFPEIRKELLAVLAQQDELPRYHELDSDLIYASGRFHRDKRWNVFMLYSYGARPERNRARCPVTCEALERIPDLSQAFFSILDGGKSIPAHTGPTRSYLRYHLGLVVPTVSPPTLRVRDVYYTWREGESLLFDDSWDHEIVNHATEPRAVLIVDVLRPLPLLPDRLNRFLRHTLGHWFYGRRIGRAADAHALSEPAQASPR